LFQNSKSDALEPFRYAGSRPSTTSRCYIV
jgi:hypothetical protein